MPKKHHLAIVLVLLFALLAASAPALTLAQGNSFRSSAAVVAPLQPVSVTVNIAGYDGPATLLIFDSAGRPAGAFEFTVAGGSGSVEVLPRGTLGEHRALLFASGRQVAEGTLYRLDAETTLRSGVAEIDGLYPRIRQLMQGALLEYELDGRMVRGYRSPDSPLLWLRDHYYQGRGFRYFDNEVLSLLDAFRDAQYADGSLPDFVARPEYGIPAFRTPVEADVEYLYVLAVFDAWQMTGDDAWLRSHLESMQRALNYTLTSPLRWEPAAGLVKRPFTIDTWDFEYGPTTTDPNSGQPAPRHWIDEQTKWGVFHGDNTGLAMALRAMAVMERQFGLWDSAWQREQLASDIMIRLNAFSWNGRFFTHHVKFIPYDVPDVDEARQLSLSNALALNRGVLTLEQGREIVQEYNRRLNRPGNLSFAEWWSIDPPFPPGAFGLAGRQGELPGEYVNGGIMPLVGGELARGAFSHGYEQYGFDILRRYEFLVRGTGASFLWYYPTGGPGIGRDTLATDGWGSSAMLGALMEGAAGIEDRGLRYSETVISPRWPASEGGLLDPVEAAYVITRYAASEAYAAYNWQRLPDNRMIIEATGSGERITVRALLPYEINPERVRQVLLNGQAYPIRIESIGESNYVVVEAAGPLVQVQIRW